MASSGLEVDGDALYDLDAEALQGGDVLGVVGEQADLADAEVGDDLAAEAYLAEDALVGGAEGFGFGAADRCGGCRASPGAWSGRW